MAYPAYKPSGVEGLGDVPAHWDVKKLKYLLTLIKNEFPQSALRIAVENIESRGHALRMDIKLEEQMVN